MKTPGCSTTWEALQGHAPRAVVPSHSMANNTTTEDAESLRCPWQKALDNFAHLTIRRYCTSERTSYSATCPQFVNTVIKERADRKARNQRCTSGPHQYLRDVQKRIPLRSNVQERPVRLDLQLRNNASVPSQPHDRPSTEHA